MPSKEGQPAVSGSEPEGDRWTDQGARERVAEIGQEEPMAHEVQLHPPLHGRGTIFDRAGAAFRRLTDRLTGAPREVRQQSREVVFGDFQASPEPAGPPPDCRACGDPLVWKPAPYSYGQNGLIFVVPEMGGWRCRNGHPGKVYLPDFDRYSEAVQNYLDTAPPG